MKTIWIINQYASTLHTGIGGRHYYLARELAKLGYKVYLIASSYTHLLHHPPKFKDSVKIESIEGFYFVWINMPKYKDARSKQRVLNWFLFTWRLLRLPKIINDNPDVILASSPAPFLFIGAKYLSNFFKSTLVFEVRDLWPLTLTELGGYSPRHPFIYFMQLVEDSAYKYSDIVLSNHQNALKYMVTRGMNIDKFFWIPNGFDKDELFKVERLSTGTEKLLPKNKFIVGYLGTLGAVNALDDFIESAEFLKNESEIALVLVGEGKRKEFLQKKAVKLNLQNVYFIDRIPKLQTQAMLTYFDVCFVGTLKSKLYDFGIASMKIPEYMASERPIIHSTSYLSSVVSKANAGIIVPSNSPQEIAEAIIKLKSMSILERNKMGHYLHPFEL